mmetsp:Transcript_25588/g.59582  ORF Transcript_25588/g.59582 Transcript_25588/m.59582 type:complete len:236 (-) Transcript_25588:1096-1803(-)
MARPPSPCRLAGLTEEEVSVDFVLCLLGKAESTASQTLQIGSELFSLLPRNLKANEHTAHISTVTAVVKQGNIQMGRQGLQKCQGRPRLLRELKAQKNLILCVRMWCSASDEVAAMGFRHLILHQRPRLEAFGSQALHHRLCIFISLCLKAQENTRRLTTVPIAELSHIAWIDAPVESDEGTGGLRDLNREEGLGSIRTLGDESQPVEIHIGSTCDCHKSLVTNTRLSNVLLEAS